MCQPYARVLLEKTLLGMTRPGSMKWVFHCLDLSSFRYPSSFRDPVHSMSMRQKPVILNMVSWRLQACHVCLPCHLIKVNTKTKATNVDFFVVCLYVAVLAGGKSDMFVILWSP